MPRLLRCLALVTFVLMLAGICLLDQPRSSWAQKQPAQKKSATPDEEAAKPDAFVQFTLPEDRDSREQLRAVMDYLEKSSIPWDIVTNTAQRLLDSRSDSFYNSRDPKTGKETATRTSVKSKINEIIGSLPKEGRQVYELNFGPTAEGLLKKGIQNNFDKATLSEAAQRFFYTKPGTQAAILLATMDLEAGNYVESAFAFQRLLTREDVDEFLTPKLLFKAAVTFKRSGDPRLLDQVNSLLARLEKKLPREGLVAGRKTLSLEQIQQELNQPYVLSAAIGDGLVTTRYGNNSRTGRGRAGTPFLEPSNTSPVNLRIQDTAAADWINQQLLATFTSLDASKNQIPLPGFFPLTTRDFIIYRTYDSVCAVAARDGLMYDGKARLAGQVCWHVPAFPDSLYKQISSTAQVQTSQQAKSNWQTFWQRQMPGLLYENAMLGSMSHDGKMVYCINDVAIPPPPTMFNPNMPVPPGGSQPNSTAPQESSTLVAVDIETGLRTWTLGENDPEPLNDQEEEKSVDAGRLTHGAIFLGAPLTVNGKLYVLFERKGLLKLMCLNPQLMQAFPRRDRRVTLPELVWVQNLGSPNNRVAQDSLRRLQPCYLSYSDGVLVCPTNSGAVIGVDINARSLLWAKYYGSTQQQPSMDETGRAFPGGGRVVIGGRVQPTNALANSWERWRAAAPIIVGNKILHTAHDSDSLQCLNLRTGEVLWSVRREKEDLYVAGVFDNKVVVVGTKSVRAFDLNNPADGKPAIVWQSLRIGTPVGHGAAGIDGLYYLPMIGTPDTPNAKEPQIWAIDMNTGLVRSKTTFRRKPQTGARDGNLRNDPRAALGNLVFHDGKLISQSPVDLSLFPLIELKRQEMTRRLEANPNDPQGLFDRGELSLDNGDLKLAIADFKASQKSNPDDILQQKIREKLYVAYTELLRADFSAAEPILNEYEALCEVQIDTEDPSEKQRLMDEQVRRRGLYLSLLAKGRERQGQLLEAFKAYRAYASLGENKQLVLVPDEPNMEMRPDVWARGRIEAMIRNLKDPALQKPLTDLVNKEWNSVREGNDLRQLREFIKIYSPHFAQAREAQLVLSERLLATNNEEDSREAQTQLMQLWASAEERPLAARAIEALARVMTRRGMMEDAVGLYSQLGTKYADVPVRDGKTGADIFGELITDKRLLPYLEPTRGPSASKYKVEMIQSQTNRNMPGLSYTLRPEGELLPFITRYNMVIEANLNDQMVSLVVSDRVTGEVRCKFGGLDPIQTQQGVNAGPPSYRIAQASGHLLLLTIGKKAYCFDLAEKRKLWEYNLLGDSAANLNPNRIETVNDGELNIGFEDGWVIRLGRSTVIQPNYATLLTREGLVTLDPATKELLWRRTNISSRAQVFGDGNYLFLVEGNTSRVFRASDGVQIPGIADFATLANSPNRINTLGRNLLLSEANSSEPRVLRLYDPFTAQNIWKKSFPAKSLTLKTIDPELTGCLTPDGQFEVLASRTGQVVASGELDPAYKASHLPPESGIGRSSATVNSPLVLLDAERVYLFLNRLENAGRNQNAFLPGRRAVYSNGIGSIAATPVNGVAYAFSRSTGKRLWFTEKLFENQTLFLERFEELPVLVAANQVQDENNNFSYRVITLDKQTGLLKYNRGHNNQNGFFSNLSFNTRTRVVEFWRYDIQLRIVPEGVAEKPAVPVP